VTIFPGALARAMGNMTREREAARGVWLPGWAESLFQDSLYALRNLRRQPGFAVVAIGTLAVSIAASWLPAMRVEPVQALRCE
jgi:ABC-type lipoprotein release transport system permease subunit